MNRDFAFRYEGHDFEEAERPSFEKRWVERIWLFLLVGSGTVIFASLAADLGSNSATWQAVRIVGPILGWSGVATAIYRWRRRKKSQKERVGDSVFVSLTDDYFLFETARARSEFLWSAFSGYAETKRVFKLYTSSSRFVMLPKRALGSDVDVQTIRQFLATRMRSLEE